MLGLPWRWGLSRKTSLPQHENHAGTIIKLPKETSQKRKTILKSAAIRKRICGEMMFLQRFSLHLGMFALLNQGIEASLAGPSIRPPAPGLAPSESVVKPEPKIVLASKIDDIPSSSSPTSKHVNAENIEDSSASSRPSETDRDSKLLTGDSETPIQEEVPGKSTLFPNPFGLSIPLNRSPYDFSHKKHCDVLRHLKVPATPRRLDTYMRPEYILTRSKTSDKWNKQDQLLSSKARQDLYVKGIDIYGCYALDLLADLKSNLSDIPVVRGDEGPWHDWQGNSQGILGIDIFSRLISKDWKGGQLHLSFTWPEALNGGPIYSYGNTLNPAGLGTRQYQGYFYTDVGRSRDVNAEMQGARIFEYWLEQHWGRNDLNYLRVGAINPWITFNKSITSGLFGFWAFDEPGVIGTTPGTANGPLVVTAPPGVSVEGVLGDNLTLKAMVASGYWDPSGGIENRRGFKQFWDLDRYGLEFFYEATWRGGTYSLNSQDNGKPWFVRLGGQNHTGIGQDNTFDIDGNYFFLTDRPRKEYRGNSQYYGMVEAMLYREPGSYSRGLTGFLKGKWSPYERRGSTTKGVYGGLAYEGIFGRNNDIVFAGYAHMLVNDGVIERSRNQTACTQVPGCSVSNFQGVIELGYSAQVTPFFFIQPKLFYIVNPNVRRDLGNTLSIGVELRVSF